MSIKKKIPKIKKMVNAFLVGQEGKISKQSIIKAGLLLGTMGLVMGKDKRSKVCRRLCQPLMKGIRALLI